MYPEMNSAEWSDSRILIDRISEAVRTLGSASGNRVLTFWANRGAGKTTFLNRVYAFYANSSIVPLGPWDASSIAPETLMQEILNAVGNVSSENRKIVLIDNLDELLRVSRSGELFSKFENQIIYQLLKRDDILIVITSRFRITQWREYDVKCSHANFPIPALTKTEVLRLTTNWHIGPERAFELSLGYPQVIAWLKDDSGLSESKLANKIGSLFSGRSIPEGQ